MSQPTHMALGTAFSVTAELGYQYPSLHPPVTHSWGGRTEEANAHDAGPGVLSWADS